MSEPRSNRRTFLVVAIRTLIGGIVAGLGALVGVFTVPPVSSKVTSDWVRAGRASNVPEGSFEERRVAFPERQGWMESTVERVIYLSRLADGRVLALSSTCTHLGCAVSWSDKDRRFHCPCHLGLYDETGRVVSGPPPRPLTPYETHVAEDVLYLRLPRA